MSLDTAQILTTILLITGTSLISIEALGRERALQIESALRKGAHRTERLFASVITMVAAPWKKQEEINNSMRKDNDKNNPTKSNFLIERLPGWAYPAFLTISFFSLFLFNYAKNKYGEFLVTIICFSSWFGACITAIIIIYLIAIFKKALEHEITFFTKVKLLALSASIGISLLLFIITILITFLSCWPAVIIFTCYIVIYLISTTIRRIMDFRERFNLGNIFIFFGLLLSISGIILQHLISANIFK